MLKTNHDLTVCLISCGELTEKECLDAIEPFRGKVVFQEVRNTYPQIAALKKMTEQVETPYLVPLDADMLLYPDAFDRIRKSIDKFSHQENWHSILFPLFDTLTQKKIMALKVLRTSILKQIPFEESATPDVIHYKRLTEAGYISINKYLDKQPIGDHVVRGKHFCYHKYRDVYRTLRVHGREWDSGVFMGGRNLDEKAQKHYNYFLTQYLLTNNMDYLYCIAGMTDGILSDLSNTSKSLEEREYAVSTKHPIDAFTRWYFEQKVNMANSVMF
jgi:hypothetical protein